MNSSESFLRASLLQKCSLSCIPAYFRQRFAGVEVLNLSVNNIGAAGATAIADAIRTSGSLALKELVVPNGMEKHTALVAACKTKGVKLV